MIVLLCVALAVLASPFRSKSRLEAENAALRRQLVVLRRMMHKRARLTNSDRLFFVQLYRWFPSVLKVITVIRPETLVRWHRAGFRRLCVPRTSSVLISRRNRLTSAHHDCAAMFRTDRLGRAIQVDEPA